MANIKTAAQSANQQSKVSSTSTVGKPVINNQSSQGKTGNKSVSSSFESARRALYGANAGAKKGPSFTLENGKTGTAYKTWNRPGVSIKTSGKYTDENGRERTAFTSTRDNGAMLGDYYGRLNNYFENGNINISDTRAFRNEAQINMAQAYKPEDAKTWQDIIDYLDWSVYSDYQDQLNRLKSSMEGYNTNLTNATNEYRSTQDLLAMQTDSLNPEYKALFGKNKSAKGRMDTAQAQLDRAKANQTALEDELSSYFMDRETWEARQRLKDMNMSRDNYREIVMKEHPEFAASPDAVEEAIDQLQKADQDRIDAHMASIGAETRLYNDRDKFTAAIGRYSANRIAEITGAAATVAKAMDEHITVNGDPILGLSGPPEKKTKLGEAVELIDNVSQKSTLYAGDAYRKITRDMNKLGKGAFDLADQTAEMAWDIGAGYLLGVDPKFIMGERVFGSEGTKASMEGATGSQAFKYAITKAGIEYASESLFGAFDKFTRGKGLQVTQDMTERIVKALADTPAGRTTLRVFLNGGEEQLEEFFSAMLSPLADKIYKDESFSELFQQNMEDIGYSMLMAGILGSLGGAANVTENRQANRELYQGELAADILARQNIQEKVNNAPLTSVKDIMDSGKGAKQEAEETKQANFAELEKRDSSITKAVRKYRNGGALTRADASMLYASGRIDRNTRDAIYRNGKSVKSSKAESKPEQTTASKEQGQKKTEGSQNKKFDKNAPSYNTRAAESHAAAFANEELAKRDEESAAEAEANLANALAEADAKAEAKEATEASANPEQNEQPKTPLQEAEEEQQRLKDEIKLRNIQKENQRMREQLAKMDAEEGKIPPPQGKKSKAKEKPVEVNPEPQQKLSNTPKIQQAPERPTAAPQTQGDAGGISVPTQTPEAVKPTPTPAPARPVGQGATLTAKANDLAAQQARNVPPPAIVEKPAVTTADIVEKANIGAGALTELYESNQDGFAEAYEELTGQPFEGYNDFEDLASRALQGEFDEDVQDQAPPVNDTTEPVGVEPAAEPATTTGTQETPGTVETKAEEKPAKVVETKPKTEKQTKNIVSVSNIKNGVNNADEVRDAIKNGQISESEVLEALGLPPRIDKETGKPKVSTYSSRRTIAQKYAAYKSEHFPDSMTDADNAKLDSLNRKQEQNKANNAKQNNKKKPEKKGAMTDEIADALHSQMKKFVVGGVQAEEIVKLLDPSSDLVLQLAEKNDLDPYDVVEEYFDTLERLGSTDIRDRGVKGQILSIKSLQRQFGSVKTNRDILVNKNEQGLTKEGAKKNATEGEQTTNSGILTHQNAEGRFREIALRRGANEEDAKSYYEAWKQDVDDLCKWTGGRIAERIPSEYAKIAERMLSGIEGNENSKFPAITFVDMQNATKEAGFYGYVMSDYPECGMIVLLNTKGERLGKHIKNRGVVFLHEPFHYFSAIYKQNNDGDVMPYENLLLKIAKGISTDKSNPVSALNIRNDLINSEANFSGASIFDKYDVKLTKDEIYSFEEMDLPDKFDFVDKKMQERFGEKENEEGIKLWEIASAKYWNNIYDETLANLTSGNSDIANGTYDIDLAKQISRNIVYDENIIPKGFYENYEQLVYDLNKIYEESVQERESEEYKSEFDFSIDSPLMEEPQNTVDDYVKNLIEHTNRSAASIAYELRENDYARLSFNKLTGYLIQESNNFEQAKEMVQLAIESYRNHGYNKYMLQDRSTTTGKGVAKNRTSVNTLRETTHGERILIGNVEYESTSNAVVQYCAEDNMNKFSYQHEYDYFKGLDKDHLNREEQEEARMMTRALTRELWERFRFGRRYINPKFKDLNRTALKDGIKFFRNYETESRGRAGSILQQTARRSVSDTIYDQARAQLVGNIENYDRVNTKDDNVKLFFTIADGLRYTDHLIEQHQAKPSADDNQKMVEHIKDYSYIRGVSRTFGPLGAVMEHVENKLLDRIAKSGDGAFDMLSMMAYGNINNILSDFNSSKAGQVAQQIRYLNMLSNFATAVSNIGNNASVIGIDSASQNIGRLLTARQFANMLEGGGVEWDMTGKGAAFWTDDAKYMRQQEFLAMAESVLSLYYGLEVDDGKLDTKLGKKSYQNDNALGKLLGTANFISMLKMQTTDAMAKARTQAGMELGINKNTKLTPEQRDTKLRESKNVAEYRLFHNESKATRAVAGIRKALDSIQIGKHIAGGKYGSIGVGTLLMPFVKVPTNVAMMAVKASPLGSVYGIAKYIQGSIALQARAEAARKGATDSDGNPIKAPTYNEVAELQRTLGRSVTNAGIALFGAALAMIGGIRDFDNEDDEDMKRLAKEHGWTGTQINIQAALRPGHEWKDGDKLVGGGWLDILGVPLVAGYQIYKETLKEDSGFAKGVLKSPGNSLLNVLDTAAEIPGIKQISELFNEWENLQRYDTLGEGISKEWATAMQYGANTFASFVIPNAVAQFAAGYDNTVRDVYHADSNWEIAKNIVKNKIPGLRETLPEAKNTFGETRSYGENRTMGLVNRMILPGTGVQVYQRSALEKLYDKLSKEGYRNVAAKQSAPKYVTVNGDDYDLNTEAQRAYDDQYSNRVAELHNTANRSDEFNQLDGMGQQYVLRALRSEAKREAEQSALDDMNVVEQVDFDRWEETLRDDPQAQVRYLCAKWEAKQLYDGGEITDFNQMDEYLSGTYSKLTDTERELLSTTYTRLDNMYEGLSKRDISSKDYTAAYALYKEYTDSDNPKYNKYTKPQIARYLDEAIGNLPGLNKKQIDWLNDDLVVYQNMPATTEAYDNLETAGLSKNTANRWLDQSAALKPRTDLGYSGISNNQKYIAIKEGNYTENEKWLLFQNVASKSAWDKVNAYRNSHPGCTYEEAIHNTYTGTKKKPHFDEIYAA